MKLIGFVRAAARRALAAAGYRQRVYAGRQRPKQPAADVAYLMGFVPPRAMPDMPAPPRPGRKALPGQYVKPYKRAGHLPPGRVSKGARRRYEAEHDTEGLRDFSAIINARR